MLSLLFPTNDELLPNLWFVELKKNNATQNAFINTWPLEELWHRIMNRPRFGNIYLNAHCTDISFLISLITTNRQFDFEKSVLRVQIKFRKICTFGIFKIIRIFQSCVFPFSQLFQWKIFHYLHFKWDSGLVYFYVVLLHSLRKYSVRDDDESLWPIIFGEAFLLTLHVAKELAKGNNFLTNIRIYLQRWELKLILVFLGWQE